MRILRVVLLWMAIVVFGLLAVFSIVFLIEAVLSNNGIDIGLTAHLGPLKKDESILFLLSRVALHMAVVAVCFHQLKRKGSSGK